MERKPLNGAELVMALPQFRMGQIDHYVFVARTHDDNYVVSTVATLQDASWGQGNYFRGPRAVERATTFAYVYAGVHFMPWEDIKARLDINPD